MQQRFLLLAPLLFFATTTFAHAQQEPAHVAEMRFVSELRKRGDIDLAMDYLERLSKKPSPELAKELPFEFAKTRLLKGTEEPESGKRLALYQQAREEFEVFLKQNPNSPRAGEARLEIAQVAVLQGKTQLSKALMQDTIQAKVTEALVARKILADAGKQLDAVLVELDAQLKKIPETDKLRRRKVELDLLQAELNRAVNLFDITLTYIDTGRDLGRDRDDAIDNAAAALEKISEKDNSTFGWQATAWLARCQVMIGKPNDARKSLARLISLVPSPANADARRLAFYFLMLIMKEYPEPTESDPLVMVTAGRKWLRDYPRHHKTAEGYGVRYLLAEKLIAHADRLPANNAEKPRAMLEARVLLRDIEHSENDYTDRARRLKIALIDKQGGFKVPVEQLKSFEDCYVRSQYELYMISKDAETEKDPKELEKKIKARREAAVKALELGLTKDDAKAVQGKFSYEVNNAKMSLAFNYLQNGKYKEAIDTAEALAKHDIRASQAPMAAAYAMQAYAQFIAEREQKVASKDDLKSDRDKLLAFAKFAEEAWPNELPANLARHQVGLMLLREKLLEEAIKKLNTVTASYPNYVLVRYQIADACLAAEKEKREPLKDTSLGSSYSDVAMKALLGIPDSALGSPDPTVNHVFLISRIRIGQEYFKAKKYAEMEKLVTPLIPKVATVRLAPDDERHAQLQREITTSLKDIALYGKYGLTDVEFKANRHAEVVKLLDPVIADIKAGELPQLKNNPQLSNALLSMALKSNMALNDLEKTKVVLEAMRSIGGDGESATFGMLIQMADLIENLIADLTKKNDQAGLTKTKKGFKQILDDTDKGQKKKSQEFTYLLAKNYSALEEHEKAVLLLEKVEPPMKTGMADMDDRNEKVYHTVRAALIRETRLSKDLRRARDLLKEAVLTPDGKPSWGVNHVDVQLEHVQLLEDEGDKYATAAKIADDWVRKLKAKAENDVQVREKYLEFYYHTAYCFYKYGQGMKEKDKAKGEKAIRDAATQLVTLEKTWMGFGSEASTRRITELLAREPELKAQFDAIKNK